MRQSLTQIPHPRLLSRAEVITPSLSRSIFALRLSPRRIDCHVSTSVRKSSLLSMCLPLTMSLSAVESGGAVLPYQADVFPDKEHFGRIFFNSE